MTDTLSAPSGFYRMTRRDAIRHGLVDATDDEQAQLDAEAHERRNRWKVEQDARRAEPAPGLTLDSLLEELDWSRDYAQHRLHPECGCTGYDGYADLCEWAYELGFTHPSDESPTPREPEPEPEPKPFSGSPLENLTIVSDCRVPRDTIYMGLPGRVSYTGSPNDGRTCTREDPCDSHAIVDARNAPLNPDDFPSLGDFLNASLLQSLNNEADDAVAELLFGDGTGEIKGLLNTDGIESERSCTYANAADVRDQFVRSFNMPLVLHPREYADVIAADPSANVVESVTVGRWTDEWSLDPKAGVTASIVSAFDVPARMVVPRTGPMYDTAAIVAAQDLEWKDRT